MKFIKVFPIIFFFTTPIIINASFQSTKIIHTPIQIADEGMPIALEVIVENPAPDVAEVNLFYRDVGDDIFYRLKMIDAGGKYIVTLDGLNVVAPGLEYYVSVMLTDSQEVTFPEVEPMNLPLIVDVKPRENIPSQLEMIIISPERNETVLEEDLLIAVSLFNAEEVLDLNSVTLFLDGRDVTTQANVTLELISYVPYVVKRGEHTVELRVRDMEGNELSALNWNFYIIEKPTVVKAFHIRGKVYGNSRYEEIGNENEWREKVNIRIDGNYSWLNYASEIFSTSDEKSDRQPLNRYFMSLKSSWLRLNFGDINPTFSDLMLRGKRVRGLSVRLGPQWGNLNIVYGQTRRSIGGSESEYGTYERKILGIRTSLGWREKFRFGLSLLKAKDDEQSIENGYRPKDNVVVGSDFHIALLGRRIDFKTEAAVSVYNDNIAGGALSKEDLEDLGVEVPFDVNPQDYESYFVINSNMVPYDLTSLSSLAYMTKLKLNFFKNLFHLKYKSIGAAYYCIENPYLQNDIQGFSISDRIRLFQNQVYLMLGYEDYYDNLSQDKSATTTSNIFSASIAFYPLINLPDVNISYRKYIRKNDIDEFEITYDTSVVPVDTITTDNRKHDVTNVYSVSLSKPVQLFNLNNNLSLTYNYFARADEWEENRLDATLTDNTSTGIRLAIRTQYTNQLTTSLSYFYNRNSSAGGQNYFNYDIVGLHVEYGLFNGQLRTHSGVKVLLGSRKTGSAETDYNRYDIILGGVYELLLDQSILFDVNLTKYTGESEDTDGFVRLGYIKRF